VSNPPVLIGVDASTGASSVALAIGDQVLARQQAGVRATAGWLLDSASALLAEAGLARNAIDAVVAARGPGGFTGVRISVGVAQGLALGLDRPTIGVSSLEVLAHTAWVQAPAAAGFLAVLDARMGEVYTAAFERVDASGSQPQLAVYRHEALMDPAAVPVCDPGWWVAGSGLVAYPMLHRCGPAGAQARCVPEIRTVMPVAQARFAAGERTAGAALQPVYLRHRVAERPSA